MTTTGGAATVDGDDNDRKTIWISLGDCASEHAFQQDLGLGGDMVFDVNDASLRARILRRLTNIFAAFEIQKRYKLVTSSIAWSASADTGELTLTFQYFNIESDEQQTFTRVFTRSS